MECFIFIKIFENCFKTIPVGVRSFISHNMASDLTSFSIIWKGGYDLDGTGRSQV